jgi:2-keto-3-deoxy-L-arabinonate dehydratase
VKRDLWKRDMTGATWSGIFPSLATPFTPDGELDIAGQRAVVRFAVDSGADGLVCFGLAGEVFRLTADERLELLHAIVEECDGRVPVLAGVGTESEHASVRLARAAAAAGADGLVIPPPVTCPPSPAELSRYFERVAGATDLPVMIQDAPEYLGVSVGPEIVEQLDARLPNLAALKLEVGADRLAPWVTALEGRVLIFCGSGGLYLLDCLENGAAGVAPGVDLVDLLVEVYGLWQREQHAAARERMRRVLPLLTFQMQDIDHFNASAKYVLRARGVISGDDLRAPALRLDSSGQHILARYLQELELAPT